MPGYNSPFPLRQESSGASLYPGIAAVFFLAALCRFLPWSSVFANGQVYFYDPDCYVRLRKVLVYITSFPATAVYDYFEGYPQGTGIITPPTMEYLLAAIFWPLRDSAQLQPVLARVLALLPPLVGALTAALSVPFTARYFGTVAGVITGIFLSVIPAHVDATLLGRFDNEMLEPFLLLVCFWTYLSTYRHQRGRTWALAGMAAVAYLSIWRGGISLLFIIGLDLLLRIACSRRDADKSRRIATGAAGLYAVVAIVLGIICLTDIWDSRALFSPRVLSWFHVALFTAAAVWMPLAAAAFRRGLSSGIASIVVPALLLLAGLGGSLIEGFAIIGGGNPWIDSIAQYQPFRSAYEVIGAFGLTLVFIPLGFWLLWQRCGDDFQEGRFMLLWCVVVLVCTAMRVRFAEYLAVNVALLAGVSAAWLASRFQLRAVTVYIGFALLLILLLLPVQAFFKVKLSDRNMFTKDDMEETITWLRDNTPSAGDPYRPYRKPSYGVLARWDYGGWIESVAQRPSVTTAYGTETYGMEEAARFFVAGTEKEMAEILSRNSVRYLLVDNLLHDMPMYSALIGHKLELFTLKADPATGALGYVPTSQLYELIVSRLYFADGSEVKVGGFRFQPVEGLRLVFESSSDAADISLPWKVSKMKVFERLSGAALSVQAVPGTPVSLEQAVETNRGRRFVYRSNKLADNNGQARFRIVYPPRLPGRTGAVGPVTIRSGSVSRELAISAGDIESGRNFSVSN